MHPLLQAALSGYVLVDPEKLSEGMWIYQISENLLQLLEKWLTSRSVKSLFLIEENISIYCPVVLYVWCALKYNSNQFSELLWNF